MKYALTTPFKLTVMPHSLYRALRTGLGHDPVCAAELPASTVPATVEGCVTVPADVPGNFELDLFRAGLIDDPFFGTNILGLRKLEDRHLFYVTTFDAPVGYIPDEETEEGRTVLHFEGVDTVFSAYVNGVHIGGGKNMFMAHEFSLPPLKPAGNELLVHIHPTMLDAQNDWNYLPPSAGAFKYHYASLHMRKAPSSFGWDILCRSVSGGIWRPVWLEIKQPPPRIEDMFLYTWEVDPDNARASLNLYYHFSTEEELCNEYEISVEGICGDSRFYEKQDVWHTFGNVQIFVSDARLWYPRNAGDPNLYDVTVTLWRRHAAVDKRTLRIGIRTVELDRTSLIDQDGRGEFRFLINHKPVFVMGTNWVPLDAFHSRDAQRLPRALALLDDIGCNAVRCWGGNVYEDDDFFDFCDEKGIMVWQDFAMGCASYPQDEEMKYNLTVEVESVVRKLRHHPSLCLWAGDNECDYFWMMCYPFTRNPGDNALTRTVIPEVLRAEDFTRPYLPSSPYIDGQAFEHRGNGLSEDHLWGPRDYFKGDYYRTATCHFASETGYHGCPAPSSLAAFLPADELWPIFDRGTEEDPFAGTPRPSWLAHQTGMELNEHNTFGYRISLMTAQVRHMFRDVPRDLDTFARMSQMSQAEAMKYFIERFRTAKWDKTGIIWWNLLDGWPQISDAVVGYDFVPKLAYFFIKRAQRPVLVAFSDPVEGSAGSQYTLHAINDTAAGLTLTYRVTDAAGLPSAEALASAPALMAGTVNVPADGRTAAGSVSLSGREDHVLYIEWTDSAGRQGASHFIAQPKGLDYAAYAQALGVWGFGGVNEERRNDKNARERRSAKETS